MANTLASLPGIQLYRDGIRYEFRAGCLSWLTAIVVSQEGFAPIEHVNAIELAEVRDIGALIFSIILIPFIIGILLLIYWIFVPQLVVRIRSEGELFATVVISKSYRADAEGMVATFRKLKFAISAKPSPVVP
jgi:hypothetical protein